MNFVVMLPPLKRIDKMKTIKSMIFDAETKWDMWKEIALDDVALKDRGKTKAEADALANYFEGQFDGLIYARDMFRFSNITLALSRNVKTRNSKTTSSSVYSNL